MDIPELIEVKAFLIDISSKESIELIGCNIKTNPIIVPKSPNLNNESDIKDPIFDCPLNLSATKS